MLSVLKTAKSSKCSSATCAQLTIRRPRNTGRNGAYPPIIPWSLQTMLRNAPNSPKKSALDGTHRRIRAAAADNPRVASEALLFFQDVIELADRCGLKNCARRGCWTNDARLGSCLRIDSSDLHDRDLDNEFHKDFVASCGHLRLRPYDATAITAFTDSAMIAVL